MSFDSEPPATFHMWRGGCSGTGVRTSDGFLVYAGAIGRAGTVKSFDDHTYRNLRVQLVSDGTLKIDGDRVILTDEYEFGSPSAAAATLMGRAANGKLEWKHDSGLTLGEFESGRSASPEQGFRRRWYEAHRERFEADIEPFAGSKRRTDGFDASADEALELLNELRRTNDVNAFQAGTQAWAVKPGTLAFNGFSGQMMLNQLVKRAEDSTELALLLIDGLTVPSSDGEARAKIAALVEYVESIRVGAHPAPGHVPFLLSYFWALADHEAWPVIWASAAAYIEYSTGESLPPDPADRYMTYLDRVRELVVDFTEFESTAAWWHTTKPVFLDEVLNDRAALNLDREGADTDQQMTNAKVLVSVAAHIGNQLVDDVAAAIGRGLSVSKPSIYWTSDRPRGDMWVDWSTKDAPGLGIRVWLNDRGAAIAVRPGLQRKGWYEEITPIITKTDYPGYRILGRADADIAEDVGLFGRKGEFVYGRWFDREELGDLDLPTAVTTVAAQLQPLFDELLAKAVGESAAIGVDADDPLEPLVAEFRSERSYPTPADEEHQADRRRFADMLAADAVALADISDLRRIWNTGRYGGPGPMPELNRSFRDASAAEYDRMIDALRYLCWGDDEDAERIDRMLTDDKLRISGLGESVIMKILAIAHPSAYVPVYPYSGPKGKRRMLQLLELEEPADGSRGELQVASNKALHDRLDRLFPGDAWGMTQFLYWYLEREDQPEIESDRDVLGELADKLLVDKPFLEDIVALLEDKGQVIFYGPPGTGKTYLARKLAETLAPDPSRRALVQFHPSSSYEDFFEGYRPESVADGDMTYRLTPGPLALMADQAAAAPGRRHIMIIDEINRANLPKVLGELLFLLEYRGESVRTLYRPEDAFELPQDLWFIGTMNTADRSIALVDAALRRRFHFIPFFPNQGPMKGLLDRWLDKNEEPGWVGELLAQVNDELEEALGGPHLQLGPSHFMKENLDVDAVRRIWKYNIEPFIEDQFFGNRQQIAHFQFDAVYKRYLDAALVEEAAELEASTTQSLEGETAETVVGVGPDAEPPEPPAQLLGDESAPGR